MERLFVAGDHIYDWDNHPEVSEIILYNSPLVSRADEVITVSGNSMKPQYHDGNKVMIETVARSETVILVASMFLESAGSLSRKPMTGFTLLIPNAMISLFQKKAQLLLDVCSV